MFYITNKSDTYLPFTAINSSGGKLDITSINIIFTLLDNNSNIIFQKLSSDITKISTNSFSVPILASDLIGVGGGYYKYEITFDNSIFELGILKIKGDTNMSFYRKYGTTAQRPTLSTGAFIGFTFFDTTLNRSVQWDGTTWSDVSGDLGSRVTTNEGDITSVTNRVTVNEGEISTTESRVTVNEGEISTTESRVTVNENDITSAEGRLTTNESSIDNLNNKSIVTN